MGTVEQPEELKAWVVEEYLRVEGQRHGVARKVIVIGTRKDAGSRPWDGVVRSRSIEGPYDYTIAIKS